MPETVLAASGVHHAPCRGPRAQGLIAPRLEGKGRCKQTAWLELNRMWNPEQVWERVPRDAVRRQPQ